MCLLCYLSHLHLFKCSNWIVCQRHLQLESCYFLLLNSCILCWVRGMSRSICWHIGLHKYFLCAQMIHFMKGRVFGWSCCHDVVSQYSVSVFCIIVQWSGWMFIYLVDMLFCVCIFIILLWGLVVAHHFQKKKKCLVTNAWTTIMHLNSCPMLWYAVQSWAAHCAALKFGCLSMLMN